MYASFKFTELVVYMNIIRTSFLLALCEQVDKIGRSQADRQLFDADGERPATGTSSFGIEHLKYYLLNGDDQKRRNVRVWLERGEIMMAADLRRDKPLREAHILVARATPSPPARTALKELRQAQLRKYLRTLELATYLGHGDYVTASMKDVLDNP